MTARTNTVELLFGRKGSGKSHRARALALEYPRRLIIDPMREAGGAGQGQLPGVVVRSFVDAVDYLRGVKDRPTFSLILRTMDPEDELQLVALAVHGEPEDPPLPDVVIYLDEIDRHCGPSTLPEPLHKLANYGRHFRVSLIGVARSPKRVHRDLTRAADAIHVGRMNEPADIDYLNDFIGSDLCERARQLQDRDFIVWPQPLPEDEPIASNSTDVPPAGGKPAEAADPAPADVPELPENEGPPRVESTDPGQPQGG